jgi:xanthine/CO dehydrogenase XdhC/CoxF family maturation factor
MSELGDVLAAIESLSARGERLALATIVAVRGSTYRRPGARLLVPEEGAPIGNLSGGCLEGDVADAARLVMREGTARLASWDLTADDRAAEVAEALRLALEAERPICLVTVVDSNTGDIPPGARLLVHPDGDVEGSLGRDDVDAAAVAAARELFAAGRSEVRHLADVVRAFVEILEPPLRLLVCGAGHDAIPVVRAAAGVGWRAVVVDDRPELLTHERFPEAAGFAPVVEPGAIASAARIDERTCAVVMTHNFLRDKGYLRALLATPVAYIGMLGPSARTRRILHELESEGVRPSERDLHRIHGPAGLDLGAEGPEEIAQAIVAEILAFRRGRGGGFLKLRPGPIHDRPRPGAEAGAPARRSR